MATRPLAFGVKLRDRRRGRTIRVLQDQRDPRRYRVEDSRNGGKTQQREHDSLSGALRDLAPRWRQPPRQSLLGFRHRRRAPRPRAGPRAATRAPPPPPAPRL